MRLDSIGFQDFRNLAHQNITLSSGINIFHGKNGHGKTNLLDAVYLLAHLNSFRSSKTSDLINWEKKSCKVEGRVHLGKSTYGLKVRMGIDGRRLFLDDILVKKPSDFFIGFRVIVFSPDGMDIIRGNPANRRKFIDRAAFRRSPRHLFHVKEYQKILKNRNISLKEGRGDLVNLYGRQIAGYGAEIVDKRIRAVAEINEILSEIYRSVVGVKQSIELSYSSKWAVEEKEEINLVNKGVLEGRLFRYLEKTASIDRARGFTGTGPHTDDISFMIDSVSASRFASQGQLRSILIALNMAEYHVLNKKFGDPPVVLLDDFSSELDEFRRRKLLEYINELEGQALITTTETGFLGDGMKRKEFEVKDGFVHDPGD